MEALIELVAGVLHLFADVELLRDHTGTKEKASKWLQTLAIVRLVFVMMLALALVALMSYLLYTAVIKHAFGGILLVLLAFLGALVWYFVMRTLQFWGEVRAYYKTPRETTPSVLVHAANTRLGKNKLDRVLGERVRE